MRKGRMTGIVFVLIAFAAGVVVGDALVRRRAQVAIAQARAETRIYQQESEKLSDILRNIRLAATEATVVEKAE